MSRRGIDMSWRGAQWREVSGDDAVKTASSVALFGGRADKSKKGRQCLPLSDFVLLRSSWSGPEGPSLYVPTLFVVLRMCTKTFLLLSG
jgi:hypothetical protein